MRYLGGHLGSSVSALVDGQLDPGSAERAWSHVLTCSPCRRLVEREGWVKTQLASMSGSEPPARLLGSLYSLDPAAEAAEAWAVVDRMEERAHRRRRAGIALAGAGSVSLAVFGLAALNGATLGIGGVPASPASTSLSRPAVTTTPTTAVVAPVASVQGRLRLPEKR